MAPQLLHVAVSYSSNMAAHHDVIVIGAGVAGIYQIKRLTDLGYDAVVLEREADLGGTWFRNRYPGARFDSESYTYGYSFSQEILDEWHWQERFSAQPENLRYLNFVADKFSLRKYMRFNCDVRRMAWQEDSTHWQLELADGEIVTANFVVTGLGPLSIPTLPEISGMDTFKGQSFHTFWWPEEDLQLQDKRVGIIGTGATGIQIIGEIADKVGNLTVFQRRPNWSSPLNNAPISAEEMDNIRRRYDEIFSNCAASPGGFEHVPDRRGFWNFSKVEREAFWDQLYQTPGFAILAANFTEIFFDEKANAEFSNYIANKIRQRVNDPEVAELLIPKDHGFGMQRLPLETNYFEAYNRDNVHLVDITAAPIEAISANGLQTAAEFYDLDVLIYATGFDAVTGAYDHMNIEGVGGIQLADKWSQGPITHLGVMTHQFPNMIMVAGPQSASGSTNFPRAIETNVNWVTALFEHVFASNYSRIEAKASAEAQWREEVTASYAKLLLRHGKGWFVGYNANIRNFDPNNIRYPAYQGGAPKYTEFLRQEAQLGYPGLTLS